MDGVGELVAACHEARAEGSAAAVAAAVVALRSFAAAAEGDAGVLGEIVQACVAGAEQRLCADVERAATACATVATANAAASADLDDMLAAVEACGVQPAGEKALARALRVAVRKRLAAAAADVDDARRQAHKNLTDPPHQRWRRWVDRQPTKPTHPHATALANVLGACCAVADVAGHGAGSLGDDAARRCAADVLQLGAVAGAKILDALTEDHDLAQSRGAAASDGAPAAVTGATAAGRTDDDIVRLDELLDELGFACQFAARFERFARDRGVLDVGSDFSLKVLNAVGAYVLLEDAYRDECVRRALRDLAEASAGDDDDDAAAADALNDVFFVLRRGVERAMATMSEQAAMAQLLRTLTTLSRDAPLNVNVFLAVAKLDEARTDGSDSFLDAVDEDVHGASPAALTRACARAFACADAARALSTDIVRELARSLPAALPLLDDFDACARAYDALAAGALAALFDEPTLAAARDGFRDDVKRDVARGGNAADAPCAAAGDAGNAAGALAQRFGAVLRQRVAAGALKALATGRGRVALANLLAADAAAAVLAAALAAPKFSQVGALLLRRDARSLQAALAALLPRDDDEVSETIRPQFAALNVALTLLNLEAPADARLVALEPAGVTRADLAAVLRKRADFAADAITAALDAASLAPSAEGEEALACFRPLRTDIETNFD
ncbi:hypothetical protein M885DRAFT_524448 [Pelagophyceae sp. CCMP2097]|nr:hypothetical protein M885DRAFT_549357 [Pelagophyceae sp. CCMP2097]KAJ1453492.1 hypothetical protein M885DRAFT_524448 [Pelagophyceae sp. CCMP2097]